MASVRMQIFAAVEDKLDAVLLALGWTKVLVNPREPVGEDQVNAIVLMYGGDLEPRGLTGYVDECELELSVGMVVQESGSETAEALLDAGFVAIDDALLDPTDIQLGGLAIGIQRMGISDPVIGRARDGAQIIGGQAIDYAVRYMAREGNASTAAP